MRRSDSVGARLSSGNQASRRILQAKLTLGPAGDEYEQEADRVAQDVMRSLAAETTQRQTPEEEELLQGSPAVQRQDLDDEELLQGKAVSRVQRQGLDDEELLQGKAVSRVQRQGLDEEELLQGKAVSRVQRQGLDEEELLQGKAVSRVQRQGLDEEELLQGKAVSRVQRQGLDEEELLQGKRIQRLEEGGPIDAPIEQAIQGARGGGAPLTPILRSSMERAFGADFSAVRVHTDSRSDDLNQSVQARAFTTGSDIFFRQGDYNPSSRDGQQLLAHELTHVVQQNAAPVEDQQGL